MNKRHHITLFEHDTLRLNQVVNNVLFDEPLLTALQQHYGAGGVPYYSLIHQGVKFNEYAGVIQVGNTVIEILPKPDRNRDEERWRSVLIGMLRTVTGVNIRASGSSNLQLHHNNILDLYFELFINEVEYLLHTGLLKQYREKNGNLNALKGRLLFARNIQQNCVRQERFFVRHTTYDTEHLLHKIIYKTICLLKQLNTQPALHSRIGNLLLRFPEMPGIRVNENLFNRLVFNRKNTGYKTAIGIARLLLLHYHPDIVRGRNHVLALVFDMNTLWEQFIAASLRRFGRQYRISPQLSAFFWRSAGHRTSLRADIVLNYKDEYCMVLDTKWKNPGAGKPSSADLQQMFAYHEYYGAKKVALVYPGDHQHKPGIFYPTASGNQEGRECGMMFIPVPAGKNIDILKWQQEIARSLSGEWHGIIK